MDSEHIQWLKRVEDGQRQIQTSVTELVGQLSELRGSMMARMESIDQRFEKLNGSVERQGREIRDIQIADAKAASHGSQTGEYVAERQRPYTVREERSSEIGEKEPSGWIVNLIRTLGTIPRVAWGFLFALLGGIFMLIGLIILTRQVEQLQPLVKTWTENRKPDIVIQRPEPVPSEGK